MDSWTSAMTSFLFALRTRRFRFLGFDFGSRLDLVGPTGGNFVAGLQVTKDVDQQTGCQAGLDIDPFGLAVANTNHEGAVRRAPHTAGRHEQRRRPSMHGPLHLAERAWREAPVLV